MSTTWSRMYHRWRSRILVKIFQSQFVFGFRANSPIFFSISRSSLRSALRKNWHYQTTHWRTDRDTDVEITVINDVIAPSTDAFKLDISSMPQMGCFNEERHEAQFHTVFFSNLSLYLLRKSITGAILTLLNCQNRVSRCDCTKRSADTSA